MSLNSSYLFRRLHVLKSTTIFLIALGFIFVFTSELEAAAGDPDASFGIEGVAAPPIPSGGGANKVIIQPDGKIIAGGTSNNWNFALVRYLSNGAVDPNFGNNGIVITDIRSTGGGGAIIGISDIALQTNGKIVIVGAADIQFGAPYPGKAYGIARFNSDGTLDNTFDGDGKLFITVGSFRDLGTALVVRNDGKIIVTGTLDRCPDCAYNTKIVTLRLNPDGSIDNSFGQSGKTTTVFSGDISATVMRQQPDGKIVIGGLGINNAVFGHAVVRLNADGTHDQTFGSSGIAHIPGNVFYERRDIALQPDGKILIGGSVGTNDNEDFELLRLNPGGTLDNSFGINGRVLTVVTNVLDRLGGIVLQPNGKIIAAGQSTQLGAPPVHHGAFLVRYNSNGSYDSGFGTGGILRTPGAGYISDAALQPNEKLVTAGSNFTARRYLLNGTRVFDFDGDRKSDVSIFRPYSAAEWYWLNSSNNQSSGLQFGVNSDRPVSADYDGDGKADVAVFRSGDWYRLNSLDNSFVAVHFGQSGDVPVPADYDADSKADLAVFRAGNWYILNSSDNSFRAEHFGISTDKPVLGDFDGDGKNDLAVYRGGVWYAQRSRDGFFGAQFGISSDKPVAADYDSDGKTDLAVYRPSDGAWYLLRSHLGFTALQFGISTDQPVPADYDNDGKMDVAVFREGVWYLQQSTAGFRTIQFGAAGDLPVPNANLP